MGALFSTVEVDPFGGETVRSDQSWRQPRKYTTYERDAIGSDEAQMRRYNQYWSRFEQPDPYDGSYNLSDPQSLNRYSYVQNDPVNFVDPSGLFSEYVEVPYPWDDDPFLETWLTGGSSLPMFRRGGGVVAPVSPPTGGGGGGGGIVIDIGEPPPQGPAPGSFWDCFGRAGLQGTKFNADAADLINQIHDQEGTARNLLAVTWMNEDSTFSLNTPPNTNGSTDVNDWDIGPFQINVTETAKIIREGGISIAGLRNQWGLTAAANQSFTGDPLDNGRLAARILNYHGGGIRAAGLYTGGTRVAERRKSYKQWAPKFKKFFDCLK